MKTSCLDKIKNSKIDQHGVFKYIQIYVRDIFTNEYKNVIRGYKKYKYHADNYSDFVNNEIQNLEIDKFVESSCQGGGRIDINQNEKTIFVYGYSQAFGRCDHQITCDILQKDYDNYKITWSDQGY